MLVGGGLGTKAVIEGRRAERALTDLKRQTPALHQLSESEARFQRLESALEKCEAALAVDPGYLPSYWSRVWLLIGLDRLQEAAEALHTAQDRDPSVRDEIGLIRPAVEKLAALPATARWRSDAARPVYDALLKVGATGAAVAVAAKLDLIRDEQGKLIRHRLDEWLGKGKGGMWGEPKSEFVVNLDNLKIDTIEPLRGLPITGLRINSTNVSTLEPLRGMALTLLEAANTKITDLSPIHGMPLKGVRLAKTGIQDISALRDAPLEWADLGYAEILDFSPLKGAPLKEIDISGNNQRKDKTFNFLIDAPIEKLYARESLVSDLSALRGKPLRKFDIKNNDVADLTPIMDAPITELSILDSPRIKDLTPLLRLTKLEKLRINYFGPLLAQLRNHPSLKLIAEGVGDYRPAEDVWKDWDARVASDRIAARIKLESLLASHCTKAADGMLEVNLASQNLSDLAALKGLKISKLSLDNNPLDDLAPLEGMPLVNLNLTSCWALIDLRPLRGQSLKVLRLFKSQVSDLSPLLGMPLEHFYFDGTPVKDLRPLLEMPKLRRVMIPRTAENLEVLRELKSLEYLGWEGDWEGDGDAGHPRLTPAEFWKRYDALKGAEPK